MNRLSSIILICFVATGCHLSAETGSSSKEGSTDSSFEKLSLEISGTYVLTVPKEQHLPLGMPMGEVILSLGIECYSGTCWGYMADKGNNPWVFNVTDNETRIELTPIVEGADDGPEFSSFDVKHTFEKVEIDRNKDGSLSNRATVYVDCQHRFGDEVAWQDANWQASLEKAANDFDVAVTSQSGKFLPWEAAFIMLDRPVHDLEDHLSVNSPPGTEFSMELTQENASIAALTWDDAPAASGQTMIVSVESGTEEMGGRLTEAEATVEVTIADLGPLERELDLAQLPAVVSGDVSLSDDADLCYSDHCLVIEPAIGYCDEGGEWYDGASWIAFWLDAKNATGLVVTSSTSAQTANTIELIDVETGQIIGTENLGQREQYTAVGLSQSFPFEGVNILGVRILTRMNCYGDGYAEEDAVVQRVWVH